MYLRLHLDHVQGLVSWLSVGAMTWYWCFIPASRHFGLSSWGMLNLEHREKKLVRDEEKVYRTGQNKIICLNGSSLTRRINVTRFTFTYLEQAGTCHIHTSVNDNTHSAPFSPLVCFVFEHVLTSEPSSCNHPKMFKQLNPRKAERKKLQLMQHFMQTIIIYLSASISSNPADHCWEVKGEHLIFSEDLM